MKYDKNILIISSKLKGLYCNKVGFDKHLVVKHMLPVLVSICDGGGVMFISKIQYPNGKIMGSFIFTRKNPW